MVSQAPVWRLLLRSMCAQCIVYASKIQGLPDPAILQSLLEAHQAICTQAAGAAVCQAP